jgi:hypothetical protein
VVLIVPCESQVDVAAGYRIDRIASKLAASMPGGRVALSARCRFLLVDDAKIRELSKAGL